MASAFGVAAALIAAVAAFGYGKATSTTAPSPETALRQFRSHNPSPSTGAVLPPVKPSAAPSPSPGSPSPRPSAASSPSPTRIAPKASPTPAPSPTAPCGWDCPYQGGPASGVYQWFQCGRTTGQCTGDQSEPQAIETIGLAIPLARPLARSGVRTVTVTSPSGFTLAHAYESEHTETFDVAGDATGIYMTHLGTNVSVLGITSSTSIAQSPRFPVYLFPLAAGKSWWGHWDDQNHNAAADYTCTALDKTTLSIGGQQVQAWLVEARLHLLGPKSQGDVDVKTWFAPRYSQTVQEVWDDNLISGGVAYKAQWMSTLANLQPSR